MLIFRALCYRGPNFHWTSHRKDYLFLFYFLFFSSFFFFLRGGGRAALPHANHLSTVCPSSYVGPLNYSPSPLLGIHSLTIQNSYKVLTIALTEVSLFILHVHPKSFTVGSLPNLSPSWALDHSNFLPPWLMSFIFPFASLIHHDEIVTQCLFFYVLQGPLSLNCALSNVHCAFVSPFVLPSTFHRPFHPSFFHSIDSSALWSIRLDGPLTVFIRINPSLEVRLPSVHCPQCGLLITPCLLN